MSRYQKRQAKRQTRPGKGVKTHFKKRTPGPAAPDPASPSFFLFLFLPFPLLSSSPMGNPLARPPPPLLSLSPLTRTPKHAKLTQNAQRHTTLKLQFFKVLQNILQNPCGTGLPPGFSPLPLDNFQKTDFALLEGDKMAPPT